jgi:hypothetical protein
MDSAVISVMWAHGAAFSMVAVPNWTALVRAGGKLTADEVIDQQWRLMMGGLTQACWLLASTVYTLMRTANGPASAIAMWCR